MSGPRSDHALALEALAMAEASTTRVFAAHGRPPIGGRSFDSRSDAELGAAVQVLDRLMLELYDRDVYKDFGTCIEVVLKRLETLGQIKPARERR